MTVAIVMGVSASGKTTVGIPLAKRMGWEFLEGDELHPPANIAKMKSGTPLTDEDRWPWLRAIAAHIDAWRAQGISGVVTCSALKRAYRDIIIDGRPDVGVVYLQGDHDLLAQRAANRHGHFMPPSLLESQLATLEEPGPDENPITVHVGPAPEALVEEIAGRL
jgi:carbohydrate kinase (thermoresistant glucokinase family)